MKILTIPTTELGYEYDLQLEPWSKKLEGFRVKGELRFPLEGGLGLGMNFLRQYDKSGWAETIPPELLKATQNYPEYQYQMLWLAANSLPARQLLESRPIILAFVCDECSVDNDKALSLCQLGQKQLLSELGLDGTKAAIKFLDKLVLDFTKGDEYEQVKRMLSPVDKRYLKLKHYSSVDYTALILDQIFPFLSGSRLGSSLIEQGVVAGRVRLSEFQDAIQLGAALGIHNPIEAIHRQRNLTSFRELHDRWAVRNNRWCTRPENQSSIDWDAQYDSPLEGNDIIQPITSYRELHQEGTDQMHCISVYHTRIKSGGYLVFRMSEPERLTIGVRRKASGDFPYEIDQICGRKNARPTEESRKEIQAWFDSCKSKKFSI